MIVADTSIWIEYLRGRPSFIDTMGVLIDEGKVVALECVFGELLQGAKSQREKNILTGYWQELPKVDEVGIWIDAGLLSYKNKLLAKGVGLIDLAIVSAARNNGLRVWSLDKQLKSILEAHEIFEA